MVRLMHVTTSMCPLLCSEIILVQSEQLRIAEGIGALRCMLVNSRLILHMHKVERSATLGFL